MTTSEGCVCTAYALARAQALAAIAQLPVPKQRLPSTRALVARLESGRYAR